MTTVYQRKQAKLNDEFIDACQNGNLEKIKYLLTSIKLKQHAEINAENYLGFSGLSKACMKGHLEIVKYLLTSSELKEQADVRLGRSSAFGYAWKNNHMEIVQFLIFDMNIEKNKYITNYLNFSDNELVESMFKARDLNKKLNKDLTTSLSVSKNKI